MFRKFHSIIYVIILITVLASCTIFAQNHNRVLYNEPEFSRFDLSSKTHELSSWVSYLQKSFSHLYRDLGIEPPTDEVFVNDFFMDIMEDDDGYYISKIIASVFFTEGGQLYVQSFNVWPDRATSYIDKALTPGEGYFTTADDFFNKLDTLDLGYFSCLLPECEYYNIQYVGDTTTFHKSAPELKRYLVNKDGIEDGEIPDDKETGNIMSVLYFSSMSEVTEGVHESSGSVGIYLNN